MADFTLVAESVDVLYAHWKSDLRGLPASMICDITKAFLASCGPILSKHKYDMETLSLQCTYAENWLYSEVRDILYPALKFVKWEKKLHVHIFWSFLMRGERIVSGKKKTCVEGFLSFGKHFLPFIEDTLAAFCYCPFSVCFWWACKGMFTILNCWHLIFERLSSSQKACCL